MKTQANVSKVLNDQGDWIGDYRVVIFEFDEQDVKSICEIVESSSISVACMHLKTDTSLTEVEMSDGSFEVPECITLAEALECTLQFKDGDIT